MSENPMPQIAFQNEGGKVWFKNVAMIMEMMGNLQTITDEMHLDGDYFDILVTLGDYGYRIHRCVISETERSDA